MRSNDEVFATPTCTKCNNSRFVPYVDRVFGSMKKACSCVDEHKKRVRNLKASRIPTTYLGYEFCDYAPESGPEDAWESNKKNFNNLVKTVQQHRIIKQEAIDILITGGVSCGKTLLAIVTLKELIMKHNYNGVYVTADELYTMAMEKSKYSNDSELNFDLDSLLDVDFLLIDTFNKLNSIEESRTSVAVMSVLSMLFQRRKNSGKSFILTSTVPLKALLQRQKFIDTLAYTVVPYRFQGNVGAEHRKSKTELLGI
jgi:DNA replication protein DnaC